MFIDKDQLLIKLNRLYHTGASCCVSLYSYPGEGKSRLLEEFLKGKRALFYKASCVPWQENFRLLRELCLRSLGEEFASVTRTSGLIKALKKASLNEPLVLVLDNFQYLSARNRRLFTYLQDLEKETSSSRLFVIVCKPSDLWEKESPGENSCFRLRSFHFFELCRLYPELSPTDRLLPSPEEIPGFWIISPKSILSGKIWSIYFFRKKAACTGWSRRNCKDITEILLLWEGSWLLSVRASGICRKSATGQG